MPRATPLTGDKTNKATTDTLKNTQPTKKPTPPPQDTPSYPTSAKETAALTKATSEIAKSAGKAAIPGWLQQNNNLPEVPDKDTTGYVGFASSASKKWNIQMMAGLNDGQPFVFHQQQYIPLDSVDFFLLSGEAFQSLMVGKEGKFMWVSRDLDEEGPTMGSNKPEIHYVCLMLVNVNGNLIPIKGDFRGTKANGIESAIRAVEAAGLPEWSKLSEAHKVSTAFPQPFGRVYHCITTQAKVSKTSGNPYHRTNCTSAPANVGQMEMVIKAFNNPEFISALNEARENYTLRIQYLDNVATNGPDKS